MADGLAGVSRAVRTHPMAALALTCLLLLGGAHLAVGAYAETIHERHVEQRTRWSESALYHYTVPVTANDSLWPEGTVLPMGEPAYFRTVSDHFGVSFTWRATPGPVTGLAHAQMTLRIRAETPEGASYWEIVHPIASGTFVNAENVALTGLIDLEPLVTETRHRTEQMPISEGKHTWTLETVVTYALTSDGRDETGKSTYTMPIRVQDPRFVLPPPEALAWTRPHADTVASNVARTAGWPGVAAALGAQALLAGALVGFVLLAWAFRLDPGRDLDERERAYRTDRARFADWLTPTTTPIDARRLPEPLLDIATVEALVHLAADARTRVLVDESARTFYAVLPTASYRCAAHASLITSPAGKTSLSPTRRIR